MLHPDAIKEFQEIYYKLYGLQLSLDEASKKACLLLRLYKKVLKPNQRGNDNGIQQD